MDSLKASVRCSDPSGAEMDEAFRSAYIFDLAETQLEVSPTLMISSISTLAHIAEPLPNTRIESLHSQIRVGGCQFQDTMASTGLHQA
jgi:hypothetical protein